MSKKGHGFWAKDKFYLQRCYDCGRENWAMAVASGQCCWCGSTTTDKDTKKETRRPLNEKK